MDVIEGKELELILDSREEGKRLDLRDRYIANANLAGRDLRNIDFSGSTLEKVDLTGADMDGDNVHKVWFKDCPMHGVKLTNCDATEATFRWIDLTDGDISGTNIFSSLLEYAKLDGLKYDDRTQYYKLRCPETGPFIGWKCCTEWRVVQLLIPADAKRVSATANTCRCSKAKSFPSRASTRPLSTTGLSLQLTLIFTMRPENGFIPAASRKTGGRILLRESTSSWKGRSVWITRPSRTGLCMI